MKLRLLFAAVTLSLTMQSEGFAQDDAKAKIDEFDRQLEKIRETFQKDAKEEFTKADRGKKVEKFMKFFNDRYAPFFDTVFAFSIANRNNQYVVAKSAGWAFNIKAYQRDLLGALIEDDAKGVKDKVYELTGFVDVTKVQEALPKNSYLVEFVRFKATPNDSRYVGWLIPSGTTSSIEMFDVGSDAEIDAIVATMYKEVSDQEGDPNKYLSEIRDKLFPGDIWKKMREREKWIISPTADLWLVPFEALPLPANSATLTPVAFRPKAKMKEYYAIEKHRISYVISGRELIKNIAPRTKAPRDNWSALIVGNPKYDDTTTLTLERTWRLVGDHRPLAEVTDLEPVCFFRNRRLQCIPRYYEYPYPPPPPPPAPPAKGHLVVGELYRSSTSGGKDFLQLGAFLDEDFRAVPGLKYIVRNLADQFKVPPENLLQDSKATATAFRRISPSKTQIIAFAGHGFYLDPKAQETAMSEEARKRLLVGNPDPFMRCGLALANAQSLKTRDPSEVLDDDALNKGIMTGNEILQMDLNETGLSLLIACQTGVGGRIPNGDSIATVRQSFQIAGSPLVLATSWKVPLENDENALTTLIVKRFVDEINKKNTLDLANCEDAIRTAQLAYLFEGQKENRRYPFFWAAFSVTGYSKAP